MGKTLSVCLARNGVTVSSPFITALKSENMEAAMGKMPNVRLTGNGETVLSATFTALKLENMEDSENIQSSMQKMRLFTLGSIWNPYLQSTKLLSFLTKSSHNLLSPENQQNVIFCSCFLTKTLSNLSKPPYPISSLNSIPFLSPLLPSMCLPLCVSGREDVKAWSSSKGREIMRSTPAMRKFVFGPLCKLWDLHNYGWWWYWK